MTIYATPFRASDKQCTGASADSGFTDIDDVVATLGLPTSQPTSRYAIYAGGDLDSIIFSDNVLFHVDGVDNIN